MYGIKRSRFRLTDEERVRTLLEFYNLIREEIKVSEEELWGKLHVIINQSNPERFKLCSSRNLKRNVIDQVAKFKRFNSDETAVQENERLHVKYFGSSWSETMKKIMPVWHNYENLVQIESAKKAGNFGVKKRKERHDSDTSKKFCDSSFPDDIVVEEEEHSSEIFIEIPQDEEPDIENFESPESVFSSVSSPELHLNSSNPIFKHYMEIKRQELETKKAKLKMQEKIAVEELELRKKQFELDVSRFEAELEERKAAREAQKEEIEAQRHERKVIREEREMHYKTIQATTALLTAVLQSGLLKKSE